MKPLPHAIAKERLVPRLLCLLLIGGVLAACQPTVKVEAPKEPITINLNIRLDAEVRVRLEEQAKEDIQANPDIF
ncbi:MAG: YnbE family lipoprotein [Kiloniellaceae bacterium]